jgi:hypothetical protein
VNENWGPDITFARWEEKIETALRMMVAVESAMGSIKEPEDEIMEKTFTSGSREEANRMGDEWCASQKGIRVLHRTEVALGDTGSLLDANHWAVTIHFESEPRE